MQNPPESRPPQNSLVDWLLGFFRPFFTKTQSASEENVEENIKENEEKYRIIFDQSSDGILLIQDGIIDCNDKAVQILGSPKEEIIGKTLADFSPPTQENGNRTNQKQEEIWAKAYAGEPQRFNWRCRRCDGDIVEMEVRLKAILVKGQPALLAVGRDITELKQAETKQLETQALLEAAVAQSPSGILIADAPDVAIRMANPAALGIRGGSMELLTGIEVRHHATKWQTFRPDGTPYPSEELPLSRAVLKGEITRNEEVIIRDEENNDHWVNVNAAPIRDSRQEIIAGIVIFHDVTKQKMVENALQDNKTFLHSLLDAIPIPVFYKDTQGRYLGFNKALENFFGKSKHELVGKSVFDTYPKHLADIYHAKDMELLEHGGTQHYEYQITSANGLRDAIFDKAVFHDSQGNINGIIGTILDVTEQKQAVDALRENEQFLSNILESIQDGVSVLNPDLTIRHANGIMETWYADKLPLEGKKCFSCYQNAESPCSPCPTLRCMKSGKTEMDIVRGLPDSGVDWLELYSFPLINRETGETTGAIEFVRDITERKRAEFDLKESESRFRGLVESSSDWIWEVDADGRYTYASPKIKDMLGYEPEEMLGKKPSDFMPADEADRIDRIYQSLFAKGAPLVDLENTNRSKDGRIVVLETSGVPIFDANGTIQGYRGIDRDITERKQAEKALQEKENKMRSIFRAAPVGIGVVANRIFMELNDRICEITGYTKEELIGQSARILYPTDEDFEFVGREKYRQIQAQGTGTVESRFQRKDGQIIDVLLSSTPLDPKDLSIGVTFTALDITERKQAEQKIRHNEERMRAIVESSPFGAFVYELKADGQLRMIDTNASTSKILGVDCRQFIGMTIEEAFPALQKTDIPNIYRHVAATGESYSQDAVDYDEQGIRGSYEIHAFQIGSNRMTVLFQDITARKRAEEALKESEEKYRLLFDSSDVLISVYNREGICQLMNHRLAALFGGEPQEFVGKSFMELHPHPQTAKEYIHRIQKVIDTGLSHDFEDQVKFPHGTRWLLSHVHPVPNAQGDYLTAQIISQDITDRKQTEKKLQESEQKHRLFLENFNGIAYQASHLTFKPFFFYGTIEEITGYTSEDFTSGRLTWSELIHPDDLNRIKKEGESLLHIPGYVADNEYRIKTKHGALKWVRDIARAFHAEDGQTCFVQGSIYDITERKLAMEQIQAERDYSTNIINETPAAIAGITMDGLCTFINPACERVTGYAKDEIIGKHWWDTFYPGEDYKQVEQLFRDLDQGPVRDYEMTLTRKDGGKSIVAWNSLSRFDKNGQQIEIIGFGNDVTERKYVEEEKAKLEEQYQQAQKMESVGRLAGGVAHDFNNMLGVILGHAAMALDQLDPTQPLYNDLQQISKAAERSADLTRQLLGFARKQTVSPKILDINETVEGMLKMLRRLIGEDIDLNWTPGADIWPIKIDPSQIDQLMANLCVNARDAIHGVGKITIETENVTFDPTYCALHADFIPGNYVKLAVSDNGCGMDKETLANIFDPFFTTKQVGEGTGLGLSTVYGIVKQNNGFINVYSEPGQGTSFRMYLPRHEGKEKQHQESPAAKQNEQGHETILLVEDEAILLNLGKTMLEKLGYRVLTALTPGQAIEQADAHAGEIHLLMTDVVMPEMNGRELAKRLLAVYPDMKRLFMSGYTANVIAHHGVLDEGVHFIQKPFSLADLSTQVRKALDG